MKYLLFICGLVLFMWIFQPSYLTINMETENPEMVSVVDSAEIVRRDATHYQANAVSQKEASSDYGYWIDAQDGDRVRLAQWSKQ